MNLLIYRLPVVTSLGMLLLLLAGCGGSDDEIRVYQVSRPESFPADTRSPTPSQTSAPIPRTTGDGSPQPQAPEGMQSQGGMQMLPGMDTQVQQIDDATWDAPDGWEEFPPSPPRKGNFRAQEAGADPLLITVTAFPGTVGGLLANVNRWRGEVGLDALREDQLTESLETVTVDGETAYIVDLTRERPDAGMLTTLGAVIPRDDSTWFVKISGDSSLVQLQKTRLETFLESMNFGY